jgi:hypothetical protein
VSSGASAEARLDLALLQFIELAPAAAAAAAAAASTTATTADEVGKIKAEERR